MNIARMKREKVALEIRILALHRSDMSRDLIDDVIHRRLRISQHITVTRLLKTFGRKIYLETTR